METLLYIINWDIGIDMSSLSLDLNCTVIVSSEIVMRSASLRISFSFDS